MAVVVLAVDVLVIMQLESQQSYQFVVHKGASDSVHRQTVCNSSCAAEMGAHSANCAAKR